MESEKPAMTDADAARRALEDAQKVRADLADKVRCPPSWHLAFGLLMGAMVAGEAGPPPVSLGVLAVCLGGVVLMARAMRKRMGFFVNGYRRGRTLWVALSLLAFVEVVLFGGIWLKDARHIAWAPLVGGAVVAAVTTFASYLWQAAYRAEMLNREGALAS
jgi:hypothetical protein